MFDDVLSKIADKQSAEEIRVRAGGGGVTVALSSGANIALPEGVLTIADVLNRATRGSVQSAEESLRHGFVTAPGGHRVGVCGSAIVRNGELMGWKDISSVNIRLCKAVPGIADRYADPVRSTLIISPPGGGKTTFLRDLIRATSNRGYMVSVADERGEIAALVNGVPALDVGRNTDVIEGTSRADAVMMLLRAMGPDVIATDEITTQADCEALRRAANCGVILFATSHREDTDTSMFERVIKIRVQNRQREYEVIRC
ncbi:MAG: stage III sporulation protein AB [Oscillospiraceae bacterium]|jgi:stage III sporulation protein AA|nr:stage III sporulation protein AB [Oscillospiraceae bacterium]